MSSATLSAKTGWLRAGNRGWSIGSVFIALVISLPLLVIVSFLLQPSNDNWQHLWNYLLADYVRNTVILGLGVGIGVLLIGVSTAWLTSMCDFPGRRWLSWALLLPMAIPAYIIAYTYTGMLDFAGPVQTALRNVFGWQAQDYWFPEIRSLGGAVCMLTLVLFPYVYMLSRAAFLEQSTCALEVSRTLGKSPWGSFYKVALPLARPAIITGLVLALMETLADYGTVQYFGVNTFTTGIFRIWFGMGDSVTAAQLSASLLLFVFFLILMEKYSRGRARFHHTSTKYNQIKRMRLTGWKAGLACMACLLPFILGFLLPALQLSVWTVMTASTSFNPDFVRLFSNSLLLAIIAAVVAVSLALVLAYSKRLVATPVVKTAAQTAALGYALPGTIVAVGVIIPFAWLDNSLDQWLREHFNVSSGLLLSGTLVALIFAYTVRFLSVSLQTVDAGLQKIKPSMDDSARSLGLKPFGVLTKIHMPMMRGTLLTALLLVFVDVLKELPATLILRPFNFNTLAVRAYEMANDEKLALAGAPALLIVLAGIVPVILLSSVMNRARAGQQS